MEDELMKISELIGKLEQAKAEFGDIEVYVYPYSGQSTVADTIEIYMQINENFLVIGD